MGSKADNKVRSIHNNSPSAWTFLLKVLRLQIGQSCHLTNILCKVTIDVFVYSSEVKSHLWVNNTNVWPMPVEVYDHMRVEDYQISTGFHKETEQHPPERKW